MSISCWKAVLAEKPVTDEKPQFEMGALFAGQINSGINAAWIPLHLSVYPEWQHKVRAEIDSIITKHRASPSQSRYDVLDSLDLDVWETEFNLIDLSLRESIRLGIPGTGFRKNTTGGDIPIGKTGEVIPKNAFVAYLFDDVHLNSRIYSEPMKFDPGRYLPDRAEDKKVPHSFLGWGTGRHPCCKYFRPCRLSDFYPFSVTHPVI